MKLKVNCFSPKYAKGQYEFDRLEDLLHWLSRIRGLPRGGAGTLLYQLVKTGHLHVHTARYGIEIDCDFHDYRLAHDLGLKAELVRFRSGGEHIRRDRAMALEFAIQVDNSVSDKTGVPP